MRDFDETCLAVTPSISPAAIKELREANKVSQPVFARYLNTSESTVEKWETGAKKPSGAALKLLSRQSVVMTFVTVIGAPPPMKRWGRYQYPRDENQLLLDEQMSRDESNEVEEDLEPLLIARRHPAPPLMLSLVQTIGALVVIFVASRLFVSQLDALGPALGLKPQLLALLLSPVATELPETMNAIIWVRQGKLKLALANISGAMMIQATVPTAF
eukprot:gene13524-15673_t